jgi:hypothetical protein
MAISWLAAQHHAIAFKHSAAEMCTGAAPVACRLAPVEAKKAHNSRCAPSLPEVVVLAVSRPSRQDKVFTYADCCATAGLFTFPAAPVVFRRRLHRRSEADCTSAAEGVDPSGNDGRLPTLMGSPQ